MNFYYARGDFGHSLAHICNAEYICHNIYSNTFIYICYCSDEDLTALYLTHKIAALHKIDTSDITKGPTILRSSGNVTINNNILAAYNRLKDRI